MTQNKSKYGVSKGRKINEETLDAQQSPNDSNFLPVLQQKKEFPEHWEKEKRQT